MRTKYGGQSCLVLAPTPRVLSVQRCRPRPVRACAARSSTALSNILPGSLRAAVRSRMEALVSDITGVADRNLEQPAANFVPQVDGRVVEWARLGTVTVKVMA